jgi:hypothetical protein
MSSCVQRADCRRSAALLGWHLNDWPDFPDPTKERIAILRARILEDAAKAGTTTTKQPYSENSQPFYGMSIPEAAISVLMKHGHPMGNVAIASALESAGFLFEQKDHQNAIETTLRRRMGSSSDIARSNPVVRVAPGTWAMANWYTEEQLKEFSAGGVPGRDFAAHRERTLAGLEAARARGVRGGTRYKSLKSRWQQLNRWQVRALQIRR